MLTLEFISFMVEDISTMVVDIIVMLVSTDSVIRCTSVVTWYIRKKKYAAKIKNAKREGKTINSHFLMPLSSQS